MLVNTTELETQDLDLDLPLVTDNDSAVAAGGKIEPSEIGPDAITKF
jgi:hypothetical protein